MKTHENGIVIAQVADEIGGDTAKSYLPSDYFGRCAIITESDLNVIAVLPNGIEAMRVAAYAITPDGGYGSVGIHPTQQGSTHESLSDWIAAGHDTSRPINQ